MSNKSPIVEGLVKQYRNYKKLLYRAVDLASQEELEGSDLERFREISKELKEDSFSPKLLKGEKEKINRVLKAYEDLELNSLQNELYLIDKPRILNATTPAYRQFLREAGYGDLDSCQHLGVAKGILKYDQAVRDRSPLNGADGTYVVNINQTAARDLIEALGGKLLTTGLMYRLFIPYIKELAQQGNAEAQATLNEMTNTKAEWLEDLILDKTRLRIGNQERGLVLPDKNGKFDRADINEFGYLTIVKDSGEFYHWYVSGDEKAAIRSRYSELSLSLGGGSSVEIDWLGVRFAKIFSIRN